MIKQIPHQKLTGSGTHSSSFSVKNIVRLILFFGFALYFNFSSRACSPFSTPVLLGQTVTPTALLLNWESQTAWACTYSIEVEVSCNSQPFTGNSPFFYSDTVNKSSPIPEAYRTQTISFSALCPGTVYQLRAREVDQSGFGFSNWTSVITFTTPGTFIPPTLNVTASNNIICPPQSTQLNAGINNACGGPYSYAWTPTLGLSSSTIANPVTSPSVTTTYSVVVTAGKYGCWTASGAITLIVSPDPPGVGTASATPAVICTGLTTTLALSSFTGNIQWQSGPNGSGPWTDIAGGVTNSFVTGPLTSNTCFRAQVSTCTGTINSNSFCVTVNQIPVMAPVVQQISCADSIARVNIGNPGTSGTPISVTWSPSPLSQLSGSTIGTYNTPGVVTFTVSFPDGCVSNASATVNPPPPAPLFTITNVTGSPSITCTFPTLTLTASNNYTYGTLTYFWSSASFTATTQSITISNQGSYTCIVTDPATSCQVTHTLPIFLNNTPPTSSVSPLSQVINCTNNTVATATGVAISPTTNVTHQWYAPGSASPVSSGGQTSIFNPSINGPNGTNTFVLVNNINGCITTKTIEVLAPGMNFPVFNVNSSQQFSIGCGSTSTTDIKIQNAQTTPTAGGVVSFTILFPGFSAPSYTTNATTIYSVNAPGTYTVIVRDDGNGCESRIPVSIIQNTFAPTIAASAPVLTLTCYTPSLVLVGTSSNSPVSYNWGFNNGSGPGNVPSASVTVNTTTAALTNSVANNYTLTVTDQVNKCISNTVVTIYQNMRPPLGAIAATQPSLTCSNASVSLSNNSTHNMLPGFPVQFGFQALQWDGPPPQQQLLNSTSYMAYTPGTYTMTVRDLNNGCIAVATTTVYDNRVYPVVNVLKTYTLDCGNSSLTITATFIPTTGLNYQWVAVPGSAVGTLTAPVLLTNSTGEYQIVATNKTNGCATKSLVTVVNGNITAGFNPDVMTGFSPLTVNFTNTSASSLNSNSITSVWAFGNGATRTTTTNVNTTTTYNAPGTYTVALFVAKGGCLDTAYKVIVVDIPSKLEVPNVFTPNGDNSNDLFFVKTANLTEITAQIFDRWGNKIYELTSNTGNIAWDGKNQSGKEVPDGTYFYTIKAKGLDGQSYDTKGTVSLYR